MGFEYASGFDNNFDCQIENSTKSLTEEETMIFSRDEENNNFNIINKHNQKLTSIMENQRWQQGFHKVFMKTLLSSLVFYNAC